MTVEGKVQTKQEWGLHLRINLASGTVEKEKLEVSLNVDNKALFVEIGDYVVTYTVKDMVEDAINVVEKEKAKCQ